MTTPILLFAAGLGTRMGALTADRPKPLVHVAGRALLDHALSLTQLPGIGPRVVNVHYKAEMIRAHLTGSDVLISDETDRLLETGGGLRRALPLLGADPVMTLNTDAVWHGPNPVGFLLSRFAPGMETLLLLIPADRAVGHRGQGDFVIDDAGLLTRGAGAIYSGLQMTRTAGLGGISQQVFSLNLFWDQVIARQGMHGVIYPGHWCDVGRPESIPLAERLLVADV